MMKSFCAIGTGSTSEAIKQATSGLNEPKAIIVFAAIEVIEEASEILMNNYPGIDVLGISGSTYSNGKVIDSSNFSGKENRNIIQVLAFYEDAEIACGVLDRLDSAPLYRIREFDENIRKVNPNSDNTVCIGFSTDYEESFVSTVKTVLENRKIPLIGGSVSGGYGKDIDYFVLLNGKKYHHAAAYMIIKNKVGKIRTYRNDTYIKRNDDIMQITKVGGGNEQRTIVEVDGKRLGKIYEEKLGIKEDTFVNDAYSVTISTPIAIVIGDKTYVASIKNLNPDGSMNIYKRVHEGGSITFMKMGDCKVMEEDLLDKINKEMKNISFVFSVDCLFRYLIYSNNGYLDSYLKGMNSLGNHVGYVGLGEQDNNQHFNQTMVCAVFE